MTTRDINKIISELHKDSTLLYEEGSYRIGQSGTGKFFDAAASMDETITKLTVLMQDISSRERAFFQGI